jgi:hypothetical protein
MKKALLRPALLIALVLIIPLTVWADIADLLIEPHIFHICYAVGTSDFVGNNQNIPATSAVLIPNKTGDYRDTINITSPIQAIMTSKDTNVVACLSAFTNSQNSRASSNLGHKDLTIIFWSRDGLPTETTIAADGIDAGEIIIYSTSFTEFGVVKRVLDPSTMLLLGSCLLGIGLFALKIRR